MDTNQIAAPPSNPRIALLIDADNVSHTNIAAMLAELSKYGTANTADKKSLGDDAKLVAILRGAVQASARDDGWAAMSAAGSAAKRQAPIDPRNYGVKNFPKLFEATGLFEIAKVDGGQSYVAEKTNKDRTTKPNK